MNRQECIGQVADKTALAKKDVEKMLDAFFETIGAALAKGDEVRFVGFGNFGVAARAARSGRNPHTGEAITIPAKKLPRFKPGAKLKEQCQ